MYNKADKGHTGIDACICVSIIRLINYVYRYSVFVKAVL